MTSADEPLLEAVIESGERAIALGDEYDLTAPDNASRLFEATLAVIAAGSAARDLGWQDPVFSKLIQARDKLAHVYRLQEIVPGYVASLLQTRVRPAVEHARRLRGG